MGPKTTEDDRRRALASTDNEVASICFDVDREVRSRPNRCGSLFNRVGYLVHLKLLCEVISLHLFPHACSDFFKPILNLFTVIMEERDGQVVKSNNGTYQDDVFCIFHNNP